jgi:exonuclease III
MPVPTTFPPPIQQPQQGYRTPLQQLLEAQQRQQQQPKIHPPGVTLATYNIQDGRNSRLVPVCRNLEAQHIDIAVITETRIHTEIHTRYCLGYDIFATYTTTQNQGGIALIYRQATNWHLESLLCHGPNAINCTLVSGEQCTPLIRAYLPPSNLNNLAYLETALAQFPTQTPILLGNLNVDLLKLHNNNRNQQVSATLTAHSLDNMLRHFQQQKAFRHRQTLW